MRKLLIASAAFLVLTGAANAQDATNQIVVSPQITVSPNIIIQQQSVAPQTTPQPAAPLPSPKYQYCATVRQDISDGFAALRPSPDTFGPRIEKMYGGLPLFVDYNIQGWTHVHTSDGYIGWVASRLIFSSSCETDD